MTNRTDGADRTPAGDDEPSALHLSLFVAALLGAFSLSLVGLLQVRSGRSGIPLAPIAVIPLSWLVLLGIFKLEPVLQSRLDWEHLKNRWYWLGSILINSCGWLLPGALAEFAPWPIFQGIRANVAGAILLLPGICFVIIFLRGRRRRKRGR